ncbi:O-methyltransferase [Actinoallomurus iriomotensis]|uniref:O-methyltransferase n=1 Tax=Actinoallomurus iriomotensis TaxID=478107 RepID=A0A9W6VP41_9ACTN|nr:O-methyltransferase [Actinoallomurus iriomotensis]GLY73191.1 O-methyltransferase [Actinoallomurus iriomotensis]
MNREIWTAVDDYFDGALVPPDAALDAALAASEEAGLPRIAVPPNQGKVLWFLARLQGARRILEVGTLGGYSTIWLARALPEDGRLITLEADPGHAAVARGNIEHAGLAKVVEVRLGPALETLPEIAAEGLGPFDMVFVDADKSAGADYFAWAVELSRPGTLIVVDNVVRRGEVVAPGNDDPDVLGVRRLADAVAADPRVTGVALQTVGRKGHDGFLMALVEDA